MCVKEITGIEIVLDFRPLAKPLRLSLTKSRAGGERILCGVSEMHCVRSRPYRAELRRRSAFRIENPRLRKMAMAGELSRVLDLIKPRADAQWETVIWAFCTAHGH